MTRDEAYKILIKYLKNKNLIKHCLAAEAAMKAIYKEVNKDSYDPNEEKIWGIVGLLHDVDYEIAQQEGKLDQHGLLIFNKEPDSIPEPIAHAIKSHNYEMTKVLPQSKMDWAISCCDQLTGLIVACALVHPQRKLAAINTQFVLNRMGEKSFARGAMREPIKLCEEKLGIPLEEFIGITLSAMQGISNELGL